MDLGEKFIRQQKAATCQSWVELAQIELPLQRHNPEFIKAFLLQDITRYNEFTQKLEASLAKQQEYSEF
jgi:hypothetical protein